MKQKPNEVEPLDGEEQLSAANVEALRAHENTYPDMISQFFEQDQICITLARKWREEEDAGSPQAVASAEDLNNARRKRDDGIKYQYDHTLQKLRFECEKISLPEITKFHEISLARTRQLFAMREVVFRDNLRSVDGERQMVKCLSNGEEVAAAIKKVFADLDAVKAMRYEPLREIRNRIEEADIDFVQMVRNLKKKEITMAASQFQALQQSIQASQEKTQSAEIARGPMISIRHSF